MFSRQLLRTCSLASRQCRILGNVSSGNGVTNLVPLISSTSVRNKSYTPVNTVVMFVPQQEAWVVERMGKFYRILEPGLNILIPIVDKVKYVQSLKEIAVDIPKQSAITSDNVTLSIDGVLYLRIVDAYLASYGVEDPEFAITQLAQTTMRSELGKIPLDKVFRERESLNVCMVEAVNKASAAWGMQCLRYEIRDIKLPPRVQEAMQMQVEAERKKRAAILESEGVREAEINKARGEAAAILALAEARADGLKLVAQALRIDSGGNAASLAVAEQYISAFDKLASKNNTLILPANAGDVSGLVTQAMSIYATLSNANEKSKHISKDSKVDKDLGEYFSDQEELQKHRSLKLEAPPPTPPVVSPGQK